MSTVWAQRKIYDPSHHDLESQMLYHPFRVHTLECVIGCSIRRHNFLLFLLLFPLFCEMLDAQSAPVIWFMPDKFESIQQTSKLKEFPKVRLSGWQTWSSTSLCWLPIHNDGTCSDLRRAPFDQWHHLWRCDPLLSWRWTVDTGHVLRIHSWMSIRLSRALKDLNLCHCKK